MEWERHPKQKLYKIFKEQGNTKGFSFEVLEECDISELEEKETYWTLFYNAKENGYVTHIGSIGNNNSEKGENHPLHKLTEKDVIDIRTRYNNRERCKDVEKIYQNKIGHSGFSKVWKGETWNHIMMEVYTEENKNFHLHNTGQAGE